LTGSGRKRRFLVFGIANVLITNLVLQLALFLMPTPLATLLSQSVNVLLGFVLYGRYVFRVQQLRKRSAWRYLLLAVVLWWTNWLGINLIADFGLTRNLAAVLMIPLLAILSYLAQKRVVFALAKN
jgi:putative flippase GtrA